MRTLSLSLKDSSEAPAAAAAIAAMSPTVVLMFGSLGWLAPEGGTHLLSSAALGAPCFGCSTAGEISSASVDDGTLSVLALRFDSPGARVEWAQAEVAGSAGSFAAGLALARGIPSEGLRHALILAPGVDLNGSALVDGAREALPPGCSLSGGLAGDAGAFLGTVQSTPAGSGSRLALVVGFYGAELDIRCACEGGWKPFGPARKATRASGNILHELDGSPALEVYKKYLGPYASGLPGSGLLFPLETRSSSRERTGIIRTILGVDEASSSLVLAGSIEEGGYLTLMHASPDGLAAAAQEAARALGALPEGDMAILAISCVGRKLAMGGLTEEEAEAVAEAVGPRAAVAGFYSNGEICGATLAACALHNQTMTLTLFSERGEL